MTCMAFKITSKKEKRKNAFNQKIQKQILN